MNVLTRRSMLACAAAGAVAVPAVASTLPAVLPDAELVQVCHDFAEAEWRNWWRYVTAPDHLADAQDTDPDWTTLAWIETTPATTPDGWHAKALAYAAWWREAYDDVEEERDTSTSLLAALLRDMVAPARAAILTRCEAEYGPLGYGYGADWRWIGRASGAVVAAPPPRTPRPDAELLSACDAYTRAKADVARLERTSADNVFAPAVATMHAAAGRVAELRAHTVGGLRAKASVCQAVLAEDGPAAVARASGDKAQRHDVLAWSTLADMAG